MRCAANEEEEEDELTLDQGQAELCGSPSVSPRAT